jgi:hypothetical protein
MAVRVAVTPGIGVGMVTRVGVAVGGWMVGGRVASTIPEAGVDVGWARSASRLDIKPVKATYMPRINTNMMIRNPNAYPLFIKPTMSIESFLCHRIDAVACNSRIILEKRRGGKQAIWGGFQASRWALNPTDLQGR